MALSTDTGADSVVLLTGATGFLGGAAAASLLLNPRVKQLLCVVRPLAGSSEQERLARSLRRFVDESVLKHILPRALVIRGDICDASTYEEPLLDRVTHVLHAAAHTS